MKKFMCILMSAILCLSISACGCEHEWQEADCTHPRTCTKCGETEGEALGHEWQEADCEHPKTCSRCGATEGEALGHDAEEWGEPYNNYVAAETIREKKCVRCDQIIDSTQEPMTSLREDQQFLLSPREFVQRLEILLKNNSKYFTVEEGGREVTVDKGDGEVPITEYQAVVKFEGKEVGIILFGNTKIEDNEEVLIDPVTPETADEHGFSSLSYLSLDVDSAFDVMVHVIMACDPSVEAYEAFIAVVGKTLDAFEQGTGIEYNDIAYYFHVAEFGAYFTVIAG